MVVTCTKLKKIYLVSVWFLLYWKIQFFPICLSLRCILYETLIKKWLLFWLNNHFCTTSVRPVFRRYWIFKLEGIFHPFCPKKRSLSSFFHDQHPVLKYNILRVLKNLVQKFFSNLNDSPPSSTGLNLSKLISSILPEIIRKP